MSRYFVFDDEARTMLLRREHHEPAAFQLAMARIRTEARKLDGKPFGNLDSHPFNNYPLLGGPTPKYSVPRNIAGLLGIVTSGVHVNVYSKAKTGDVLVMVRETGFREMLPATNKMEPLFGGVVLNTDQSPLDAPIRMVLGDSETVLVDGEIPEAAGLAMLDFLVCHRLLGMSEEKTGALEEHLHPSLAM
ncbi:hypothetical protein C8A01DRAFT_34493 [Parachaetomium inaequale]|uniref:Uncharacterized protein n=1 Tax=Parachaetomium inaequale TaxID=2588326 RepID=A0AAN6PIC2_9PEZI|nr:hypothetical protein C8A01DRAFT_34493 [Parachaetomium inaequale]